MKRRIHKNSLKAYASLKLEPAEWQVLYTYKNKKKLTDKDVQPEYFSRFSAQPRITSLLDKGILQECGDVKCPISRRTVRVCKITALGRKALKG